MLCLAFTINSFISHSKNSKVFQLEVRRSSRPPPPPPPPPHTRKKAKKNTKTRPQQEKLKGKRKMFTASLFFNAKGWGRTRAKEKKRFSYFSRSPHPSPSPLPLWAGVQFSCDSFLAFNVQRSKTNMRKRGL